MGKRVKNGSKWYKALAISSVVLVVLVAIGTVYQVWSIATYKASFQFDCEVKQIDYVRPVGNGSCVFPLVQGDTAFCALPRDLHCSGAAGDVPVLKTVFALRGK